jgi:hypothetical protein
MGDLASFRELVDLLGLRERQLLAGRLCVFDLAQVHDHLRDTLMTQLDRKRSTRTNTLNE